MTERLLRTRIKSNIRTVSAGLRQSGDGLTSSKEDAMAHPWTYPGDELPLRFASLQLDSPDTVGFNRTLFAEAE